MALPNPNIGTGAEVPDEQKQTQQSYDEVFNDEDSTGEMMLQHDAPEFDEPGLIALQTVIDEDDWDTIREYAAYADEESSTFSVPSDWQYWNMSTAPPDPNVTYQPPASGDVDPETDTVVP